MKIAKIGLQLYSVRENFKTEEMALNTFKKIKELGYDQAQTAGCYGMDYARFYEIANQAGIEIIGTHDSFDMMKSNLDEMIEKTKKLHTTNMGIGAFYPKSEEDVKWFIKYANEIAKKLSKEGMKFTYHNHTHEFIRYDNGKTAMDMLIEGLDPENITFCLDTCWVQYAGVDVCQLIKRLKGRIDIIHLKDLKVVRNESGKVETKIAYLGEGNMNFDGIISEALNSNVKYFCVEQDDCPVEFEHDLKESRDFLHKNFM